MNEEWTTEALDLRTAASRIPGRPHLSTVWRWTLKGSRGVKLESFVRGGRRFTTSAAIHRFIQATTSASRADVPRELPNPVARHRELQIAAAEAFCKQAGL